ncbi:DUF4870 domain-containing protein [Sporosarcina sp. CAU 1771]
MDNRGLKILVHASAFFAPYAVPIIIYIFCHFYKKDLEVESLAIQAVLFQLVMGAFFMISFALIVVLIGIPLVIALGIAWLVIPIIAIIKTLNYEEYKYPVVGRWF